MKRTVVIMAGGKGERFWPHSRTSLPKQFLALTGGKKTMIQLTVERHLSVIPQEDIFIVTNKDYVALAREQLPEIPEQNILAEPLARNTAPCIGLAAATIRRKYEDAIMIVLAADHMVANTALYLDNLQQAVQIAAEGDNLVTIGIVPSYPETGYGYINFDAKNKVCGHENAYPVRQFVEKPDLETAKKYCVSGEYLWNSGMFVWKISTILRNYKALLPEMYRGVLEIGGALGTPEYEDVLNRCFQSFHPISIDYGIMEHADKILTVPSNFGWDDVGSWLAIERVNSPDGDGNVMRGDIIAADTQNSTILGDNKLIAALGIKDLIVVDTADALLVCHKNNVQNIKVIVEELKEAKRKDLL